MQEKIIAVASDHAGCPLKTAVVAYLEQLGVPTLDLGVYTPDVSVNYVEQADKLARALFEKRATAGILLCGSGIGMSMAANRYPFIRAALVCNADLAGLARAHNDANVLVLPGRFMDIETAKSCIDAFLTTPFEAGRHVARVNSLGDLPHEF